MNERATLIKKTKESLNKEIFVKLVLSKPADQVDYKKVTARLVQIKGKNMLSIVSSYETKDVTKNYLVAKGIDDLHKLINSSFENAALFTLESNYQLERTGSGRDKIHKSAPTTQTVPDKNHNHSKKRLISIDRPFLATLGLLNADGEIKTKLTGKYKQIESFINILSKTMRESPLKDRGRIRVYDMGAGSAYVSFAIYDYVENSLNKEVKLTGVDTNDHLVQQNNQFAKKLGLAGINFITTAIIGLGDIETDIVVALHACNTATDDAIHSGMRAAAEIIIVSPCCHQELRSKMKNPDVLKPMLKFGTYKEQAAEMLTDTIRTLILEIYGYKTNLFEFVSDEHSGKNNIIVAVKKQSNQDKEKYISQLLCIKEFYGISEDLYLESLLKDQSESSP